MKNTFMTISLLGMLSLTSPLCYTAPAYAGNSNAESTLEGMGDTSMFYQALLNTGVINELVENEHYTIFAPTNAAFARLTQTQYPCFYSAQCRPQIAALLRDHIIVGRHTLADLATYGQGLPTLGSRTVHVEEAYVNDYRIEGQQILSESDAGGNAIYRINGVITSPQELSQFQAVAYQPGTANTVTEQTVVRRYDPATYYPYGATAAYPAGGMVAQPGDGNATTTTTVTQTYDNDQ